MRPLWKFWILALLLCFSILFLHAQTRVTLGTGTSTNRSPFGADYGYERTAALYLASEIGTTGWITNLSWYVSTVATDVELPAKIYLKTTTATSLSVTSWASMISGATTVFDRDKLFYITRWNSIDITDYNYTGDNLLVLCETNYGGTGPASWPLFRFTNVGTNRHETWFNNSTPPTGNGTLSVDRPNIRITFNGTPSNPRHVAEWENIQGALIAYAPDYDGFGIPTDMVREMSETVDIYLLVSSGSQTTAVNALIAAGVPPARIKVINKTVNSYWTRDYGPQFVYVDGPSGSRQLKVVDHTYSRPGRPADNESPAAVANYMGIGYYDMEMIDTGGNIVGNGAGTEMRTTLVQNDNPDKTLAQIQEQYTRYYGMSSLQLYTDPWTHYIDHIDCWAKVIPGNKVIISQVPVGNSQYTAMENVATAWATNNPGWTIYRIYTPNGEPYTNAVYINTATSKKILVPQMGNANDAAALAVYASALPSEYEIIGYPATGGPAWLPEDAIHCRINTIPLADEEPPLPVELSSFTVTLSTTNQALLTWVTQTETNVSGFNIYRGSSDDLALASQLSVFIEATNTSQQQTYIYMDEDVWESGTYYYWLESRDLDGSNQFYGPVSIIIDPQGQQTPPLELVTGIDGVYPNPFNPVTTISYSVKTAGEVELLIYNAKGQLVRNLLHETKQPGNHRLQWDSRDNNGSPCASGLYNVVLRAGNRNYSRKAVLLK